MDTKNLMQDVMKFDIQSVQPLAMVDQADSKVDISLLFEMDGSKVSQPFQALPSETLNLGEISPSNLARLDTAVLTLVEYLLSVQTDH